MGKKTKSTEPDLIPLSSTSHNNSITTSLAPPPTNLQSDQPSDQKNQTNDQKNLSHLPKTSLPETIKFLAQQYYDEIATIQKELVALAQQYRDEANSLRSSLKGKPTHEVIKKTLRHESSSRHAHLESMRIDQHLLHNKIELLGLFLQHVQKSNNKSNAAFYLKYIVNNPQFQTDADQTFIRQHFEPWLQPELNTARKNYKNLGSEALSILKYHLQLAIAKLIKPLKEKGYLATEEEKSQISSLENFYIQIEDSVDLEDIKSHYEAITKNKHFQNDNIIVRFIRNTRDFFPVDSRPQPQFPPGSYAGLCYDSPHLLPTTQSRRSNYSQQSSQLGDATLLVTYQQQTRRPPRQTHSITHSVPTIPEEPVPEPTIGSPSVRTGDWTKYHNNHK